MKNEYYVKDGIAYITLKRRNGNDLECMISESDLSKLDNVSSLYANYDPKLDGYYVRCNFIQDGKRRKEYLHRLIMDCPSGKVVDHKSRNTLDNTRENLRIVDHSQNMANRGLTKANKTGFKGVRQKDKYPLLKALAYDLRAFHKYRDCAVTNFRIDNIRQFLQDVKAKLTWSEYLFAKMYYERGYYRPFVTFVVYCLGFGILDQLK